MQVPLDEVYFPAEDRARQNYGEIRDLVKSLKLNGQLQPVLIRDFDPEEWPDAEEDYEYVLVDGGRRYVALNLATRKEIDVPDLEVGHIEASHKSEVDATTALVLEYETNEERKDFDWQEKALHIRRIHERLLEEKSDNWGLRQTAEVLNTTKATISRYLQLTEDEELWQAEEVQSADTFRTAHKQLQILQDRKEREKIVQHRDRMEELREGGDLAEVSMDDVEDLKRTGAEMSEEAEAERERTREEGPRIVTCDDCRHWLSDVPDEHFDWIHWDPPYGGGQDGGAFTSHKKIADDWQSASKLMREVIPEIYRVLRDGHWLAIWCHPTRTNWLARYLRGHEKSESGKWCTHCGKPWRIDKLTGICTKNPDWHFWVNPYPNIWYKEDRHSSGQEIRRFLVNQYETFLLAAKQDENDNPILPKSDRGNVFAVPMPPRNTRRHVMHKPAKLLKRVISLISVPGSLGADPSAGGGSIIRAAIGSGRKINVCEIDEDYANTCREVARETVKNVSIEGVSFAE